MHVDPCSPAPQVVERAAQVIRRGGVVLYPTDTVYGLGCNPFDERALGRLLEIKGRPERKGVLLLVSTYTLVKDICTDIPEVFYEISKSLWPGPVTFLLRGRAGVSPRILGEEGKVGVRCPDLAFLQLWMEAIPGPLVSTSANRSGQPAPARREELRELFGPEVDLFLEGGDVNPDSQPSTVVDLVVDPPRMVRAGRQAVDVQAWLERWESDSLG